MLQKKPLFGTLRLISFIGVLGFALTGKADPECQNRNICVYSEMPLLNQGSIQMQTAIQQATGAAFPGLCGPTTMTMVMQGYAREYGVDSSLFGDVRKISPEQLTVINFQNTSRCEKVGPVDVCDDGSGEAGTSPTSAQLLMNRFVQSTTQSVVLPADKQYMTPGVIQRCEYGEGGGTMNCQDYADYENQVLVDRVTDSEILLEPQIPDLFNDFKRTKNAGYISVCSSSKSVLGVRVPVGCHMMALNGIENGRLKIFDPWGRIYTVAQSGNRIVNPSSAFGFVASNGGNVELVGNMKFRLSVFFSHSIFGTHRFQQTDLALEVKRSDLASQASTLVQTLLDF